MAFFYKVSLGDLLISLRPRLSGLVTLLEDKVERKLVALEVKVLLLPPFRLVRLIGEQLTFRLV